MVKQTHPPFDDWLLSDEQLTPQQSYDLQEHLRNCETCRQVESGWNQVERLLHSAGMMAPAAGFSTRWQTRLAAQRAKQHRQQSWLVFLGIAFLSIITLITLAGVMITIWQSPAQFFFGVLYRLSQIHHTLSQLGFYMGDLIQAIPGFSYLGVFFLVGFATFSCVLWLVAFRQLTGVRRWVQ